MTAAIVCRYPAVIVVEPSHPNDFQSRRFRMQVRRRRSKRSTVGMRGASPRLPLAKEAPPCGRNASGARTTETTNPGPRTTRAVLQ